MPLDATARFKAKQGLQFKKGKTVTGRGGVGGEQIAEGGSRGLTLNLEAGR